METLQPGDLVVTRDYGLQPIRWAGRRRVPGRGRFAPVRLRTGALPGLDGDLLVSPQHRMLLVGHHAELTFGEHEVLVAARHLVDGRSVTLQPTEAVTYVHVLFDAHEIICAEGAATESFHPGGMGLPAVEGAARGELLALRPGLRAFLASYGPAARRCLKAQEARLMR